MQPQWIIEKKRDGHALTPEETCFMVNGHVAGTVPDYQMAALAMAVFFRGMTDAETAALTRCMRDSGATMNFSNLSAPKIDKHSTGGVGDKISLALAPLAAAAGLIVPMIAGRGLGATGGTIDKLESIPGYRTDLDARAFEKVLRHCGCSIISQSDAIAPADKRLYALRDVTGTVPSIPLITASILSKKLAAGLDGLVLDVKWGRGAFMRDYATARELATRLVNTARELGLPCRALLTDMNRPLGRCAGNAPEIFEAVEVLRGAGPNDVRQLTIELGARMLRMGGMAENTDTARGVLIRLLDSGAAHESFLAMVEAHGGDPRFFDRQTAFDTQSAAWMPVPAPHAGYVHDVDAGLIGRACVALGAGRSNIKEKIDHAAGVAAMKQIGEPVEKGEPLAILRAARSDRLDAAVKLVADAFKCPSEPPPEPAPLIAEEI